MSSNAHGSESPLGAAKRLFRAKDYQASLTVCRSILRTAPNNRDAKYYLGLNLFRLHDWAQAEPAFQELAHRNPKDYRAQHSHALTLEKLGRIDDARAAARRVLEVEPTFDPARKLVARLDGRHPSTRAELRLSVAPHTVWPLTPGTVHVGRSRKSEVCIPDGSVSARHLDLTFAHGKWTATDPGSTNGTYVNGQRIVSHILLPGDTMKLGNVSLVYHAPLPVGTSYEQPMTAGDAKARPTPAAPNDPRARPAKVQESDPRVKPAPGANAARELAESGPGRLELEAHRLLRSYLSRFILAAGATAAAFILASKPPQLRAYAYRAAGIEHAEEILAKALMTPAPESYFQNLRADIEKAKVEELLILQRFQYYAVGLLVIAAFVAITAVLGSVITRYRFYERRIDLREGVLFRRNTMTWLYEITELTQETPLTLAIVGTSSLHIHTEATRPQPQRYVRQLRATGFSNNRTIETLCEKYNRRIVLQRSSIKGTWI